MAKKSTQLRDDIFNLLSRLTEKAKMDWFYEEYCNKKTLKLDDAECLTTAFIKENFDGFTETELFAILGYLTMAGASSVSTMAEELDNYLSNKK